MATDEMAVARQSRRKKNTTTTARIAPSIMAAMALLEFAVIEHQPLLRVLMFTLAYLFLALAMKLYIHVFFPLFLRCADHTLPRGSMFLLAVIFHASAVGLISPLLLDHINKAGV